jgi:hypothetical protein
VRESTAGVQLCATAWERLSSSSSLLVARRYVADDVSDGIRKLARAIKFGRLIAEFLVLPADRGIEHLADL